MRGARSKAHLILSSMDEGEWLHAITIADRTGISSREVSARLKILRAKGQVEFRTGLTRFGLQRVGGRGEWRTKEAVA